MNPKNINTNPVRAFKDRTVRAANGCLEWVGSKDKHGYGMLGIGGERWKAHRLAFHLFVGPVPSDLHVCHHCDNRSCVDIDHLFLGTTRDNILDCVAKKRNRSSFKDNPPRGEKHPRAILSKEDADFIRRNYVKGHRSKPGNAIELSKMFGVCVEHIYSVANGTSRRSEIEKQ